MLLVPENKQAEEEKEGTVRSDEELRNKEKQYEALAAAIDDIQNNLKIVIKTATNLELFETVAKYSMVLSFLLSPSVCKNLHADL